MNKQIDTNSTNSTNSTFKEYINETIQDITPEISFGKIDESGAGLARVLSKLEDNSDFLIITAYRGNNSKKDNQKANNELIKSIRASLTKKVGAYKLIGHWKECSLPLKSNQKISDCSKVGEQLKIH